MPFLLARLSATASGEAAAVLTPGARAIGIVYLSYFFVAVAPLLLTRGILSPGDAAATANGILAHESAWRAAIALNLVGNLIYVAVAVLFYHLFEHVDRTMALLATVLAVMGATVQIVALLLQAAPLAILKYARLGSVAGMAQLQVDVLVMLRVYNESYSLSFVIFSLFDITIGVLINRSTFLPRWIGVLMVLAGVGWATFLC